MAHLTSLKALRFFNRRVLPMPRRIRLAAFVAASLLGPVARAGTGTSGEAPGPQCKSYGPCRLPDSVDALVGGGNARTPDMALNFGLLMPAMTGPGYDFVCEEIFGGRIGDRSRVGPDGRVYVPALDGVYIPADGCSWARSPGPLDGQSVWDVDFDPTVPGKIWMIGSDPRILALSLDGGKTVTVKQMFPQPLRFIRVAVAPSDSRVIYLAGYRSTIPLVLAVSTDGGETFAVNDNASMNVAKSNQVVDLLGIAPNDPKMLYFIVTNPDGDEIWKSTDSGHSLAKILTL